MFFSELPQTVVEEAIYPKNDPSKPFERVSLGLAAKELR